MWYLAHSLIEANDTKNPYMFMDLEAAKKITTRFYQQQNPGVTLPKVLKSQQPNIIVIVLESWTADLIKALGGEPNVTPNFDNLRKEGLLLTQMYGSGYRTDQGLISILSGFPSQPINSIITTPSKSEKLPSLTKELVSKGYSTSFYYGGEIEFANMKSYLVNTGFQKIIDKQSFTKQQLNSKWGAHDEFVFQKQIQNLADEKTPFFSVMLTLSTHEPFEVPMQTPFTGNTDEEKFKKAAFYTDHCLADYFTAAKKQSWFKNTLFILVADHGHHLPKNRNMDTPEGRRITALILGGALTDSLQGKTLDKICNQNDIPTTLLAQLNLPSDKFQWSKNIFDPTSKDFAYYSNENCLGWVTPQRTYVYSFTSKKTQAFPPVSPTFVSDSALIQAQAYLQTLYQTYLDY